MAYDDEHLHRAVTDWPLVLCGPILRRVTRASVAVFIATSQPFEGTLVVHDQPGGGRQPLDQANPPHTSLTLGQRLHVAVIEATGLELSPGRVYGYDLELDTGTSTQSLSDLGLLSGNVPLGYVVDELPGFAIPGSLDTLRIVHGSCRKPHGCVHATGTDPDVLPMVDRLIELDRTNPHARPHQLLLTGDQIYSDDVPAALLAAATSAGRELLGWDRPEQFPDRGGTGVVADDHVAVWPGKRSDFLHVQGIKDKPPGSDPATWSDYAANHLLFFSEWCALYLFAWSPELWQRRDAVDSDDRDAHPTHTYYVLPDAADVWEDSPDTTTPSLVYAQGMPWVRRALANVATYMVFDDHDVTDDWFLNAKVDEQLRGQGTVAHVGGRRLMRNALAAYAVFQHWGNDPDAFSTGTPGGDLLALLDAGSGTPPLGQPGSEHDADTLLDVGATPLGTDRRNERLRWDLDLVFDEHRLLLLDCRTWRGYPSGSVHVDVADLIAAAGDRVDEVADLGSAALREIGLAWGDAVERSAGDLHAFLVSGVVLLSAAADLAEDLAADVPGWADEVQVVVDETDLWLGMLADALAAAGAAWAHEVLTDAASSLGVVGVDANGPAALGAAAVSEALGQASHRIRTGTDEFLADTGLDDLSDEALATQELLGHAALWCRNMGWHLLGGTLSYSRASRFAVAAAREWLATTSAAAALSFGQLGDDVAAALAEASTASGDWLAQLDELYVAHKGIVDPVWDLLVGDGNKKRNAELISEPALEFQVRDRVAQQDRHRELTLVVSPGPVVGHDLVEFLQRARTLEAEYSTGLGAETWDNEPWSGNMPALTRLLDELAGLGSVVFLSGDVHYAFSKVSDWVGPTGQAARFVQLTSSSMKNADSNTHLIGTVDEVVDDVAEAAHAQFDFVELLPTAEEWAQLPADLANDVPSVDDVVEQLDATAAGIREDLGDLAMEGSWDWGLWWVPDFRDAVTREVEEGWYDLKVSGLQHLEAVTRTVHDLWEDPVKALVGDRLQSVPLMQEQVLLLFDSLGVDVEDLPELHTTVLRDRRAEERGGDSPGLQGRIDDLSWPTNRKVLVRRDRVTVGHSNLGVITTQRTALGRFLTHDLHWHPFDEPVDERPVDPEEDPSWRDDWIITRHVAGLVPPAPHDGGAVGVPPPAVVGFDDLVLDVSSPGMVLADQRRIHVIDPDGPTMPSVAVDVRLGGVTDGHDAALGRRVRLEVAFVNDRRDDVVHVPGPGPTNWASLPPGQTTWSPTFPRACGGELTVHAEVDDGARTVSAATPAGAHVLWGTNPDKVDIHDEIGVDTNRLVVVHRESRFVQFATNPADIGGRVMGPHQVLQSFDHGYGLGQLTMSPEPEPEELWDWRANIASTLARLDGFRADAQVYAQQVQQGLAWDDATGRGPPWPPAEGVAQPEAPDFTVDELDLEMWCRYNSGRRYHDWNQASQTWEQQDSGSAGVTVYAPELLEMRMQVDVGDFPRGWS